MKIFRETVPIRECNHSSSIIYKLIDNNEYKNESSLNSNYSIKEAKVIPKTVVS